MNLLIRALISFIKSDDIYIENTNLKNQIIIRLRKILNSQGNVKATTEELIQVLGGTIGKQKTLSVMHMLLKNYGSELGTNEKEIYEQNVQRLQDEIGHQGINSLNTGRQSRDSKTDNQFPSTPNQLNNSFEHIREQNNSYSGSDMVASITIPGEGPVIIGELANVSYSVLREKVPVRSLGRVSMKGYTRGMRTITGILSFIVFDESVVYRCMKELKDRGYRILMDEMPLFDITLTMANEFGSKSSLTIYGVSTFTEGMVMSVNDMMTQNVYEFYALDIDPIAKTII